MGMSLTYKILSNNLIKGELKVNSPNILQIVLFYYISPLKFICS